MNQQSDHQQSSSQTLFHMESKPISTLKKLSKCSRSELIDLRERNLQMLSNSSVIDILPDKGRKLKETNQMIEELLLTVFDEVTVESTNHLDCPLTRKLEEMSVLTPHQGARKRSVDLANQQAYSNYSSNGLLFRKPRRKVYSSSTTTLPSIFRIHNHNTPHYIQQNSNTSQHKLPDQSKVRMISLDESMTLQTEQQPSVKKVYNLISSSYYRH
ncbi:uncharacterized protein BX663DRAFT_512785 [Cokeromyces recurvatus]|uniref:uncharacterized protein n=1 Tax=Cokeromyces recurvatus TaxID=90255 RepID=UPI002220C13B|nr:uncharacterized protein BX663DRAFT_512785 [Cokeromyces recurvatus]KAI7901906.1 hypothetical protein BX663DRAFT_512785 [Cokeromyces recurvatus]